MRRKRKKGLTAEALHKFLASLDPDPERAGEKYLDLRRHLVIKLKSWGCPDPDEFAAEAIERVMRRWLDMSHPFEGNLDAYLATAAYNLLQERARRRWWQVELSDDLVQPVADSVEERRDECLDRCARQLTVAEHDLVIEYYREDKGAKIEHRQKLAAELGISLNALRIRAHRIRASLLPCIEECMKDDLVMK